MKKETSENEHMKHSKLGSIINFNSNQEPPGSNKKPSASKEEEQKLLKIGQPGKQTSGVTKTGLRSCCRYKNNDNNSQYLHVSPSHIGGNQTSWEGNNGYGLKGGILTNLPEIQYVFAHAWIVSDNVPGHRNGIKLYQKSKSKNTQSKSVGKGWFIMQYLCIYLTASGNLRRKSWGTLGYIMKIFALDNGRLWNVGRKDKTPHSARFLDPRPANRLREWKVKISYVFGTVYFGKVSKKRGNPEFSGEQSNPK